MFLVAALCFYSTPAAQAPSNLTYQPDSLSYDDAGPSSASPTVTGIVTYWSVAPALPANLKIDSTTGVISGYPTALFPWTAFTVTASNTSGSTTGVIHIRSVGGLSVRPGIESTRVRLDARSLSFTLPASSRVILEAFTPDGRRAAVLLSEDLPAGAHARRLNTASLPSGLYFYRLRAGEMVETRKVMLPK